jgi:SAM-dependent methyltransferase
MATYDPTIFDVGDMDAARSIILTPEGSPTEERWQVETPHVADLIGHALPTIRPGELVLDYGCGIGRIAKELIARHRCRVVGVDISTNMRALALDYVGSEDFLASSPTMLDAMVESGLRVRAAISVWVLQHCLHPHEDIERIRRALVPTGNLFVLNNLYRAVPTKEKAWVNDGIDIKGLVADMLTLRKSGILPKDKIAPAMAKIHFWATYCNDKAP